MPIEPTDEPGKKKPVPADTSKAPEPAPKTEPFDPVFNGLNHEPIGFYDLATAPSKNA